jgi:hypothetical protein
VIGSIIWGIVVSIIAIGISFLSAFLGTTIYNFIDHHMPPIYVFFLVGAILQSLNPIDVDNIKG